ncbi:MAG TPA: hypothetical protein VGS12_09805, partial [Caulobacteraceae bacterium]|nr:hypothetical protein [Caulobacteraceae bacterium]
MRARPTAKLKVLNHDAARAYAPREDALAMLARKGRLSGARLWAAKTYGVLIRTDQIADGASIRSFLEMRPRGGQGAGALAELSGAEWVAECQWRLARAQLEALNANPERVVVLGLVCGTGLHPREIAEAANVKKDAVAIETILFQGLD